MLANQASIGLLSISYVRHLAFGIFLSNRNESQMRLNKALVSGLIILGTAACAPATRFYEGPEKPKESVSRLVIRNSSAVFASDAIFVTHIDGKDIGNSLTTAANAMLSPGEHVLRITITDYGGLFVIPTKEGRGVAFPGYYEIHINLKPGLAYLVNFEFQNGAKNIESMCIYEHANDFGNFVMGSKREESKKLSCAGPTFDPASAKDICTTTNLRMDHLPKSVGQFCAAQGFKK